ncbi:response regulator [Kallotenue papyrolyticum]|uniref:response regulator n=1 Tax=Kallotenue papyrolyticum TaxID=1325125 RepID=UPI0004785B03|nr:response regulator [Kallotenue papyrolyticum]
MHTTILVVEDDRALRSVLCDILEDEGFRAVAVPSPAALAQTAPADADLLITDLLFDFEPVGLDVIRAARRTIRPDLPTLICSGAREQVERYAIEIELLGAQLLLKPFSVDELLGAVNRALDTPQPEPHGALV